MSFMPNATRVDGLACVTSALGRVVFWSTGFVESVACMKFFAPPCMFIMPRSEFIVFEGQSSTAWSTASPGTLCTSCERGNSVAPSPMRCRMCLDEAQSRAGMVTTLVEPFLTMAMQRAVQKLGSQPARRVTGVVAPIDYKIFKSIHHMLVCQLPVPRAGQGISMNQYGGPVQKAGMHGGRVSFGFDIHVTEVVASVTMERSWLQRSNKSRNSHLLSCGPVFHQEDGCIGCVACPLSFTFKPNGKYQGLITGVMSVQHDYFVLDVAGTFHGMGVSRHRDEEAVVLNRVMLCQHANRLRARGAQFSEAQIATIDLHLNAVLRSLPVEPLSDDDDDEQPVDEEGDEVDDEASGKGESNL